MSRIKYTENNIPKNTFFRVHYLTQGKVKGMPTGVKRITIATLVDKTTGKRLAEATSFCDSRDNDNKKIGRAMACGRAFKAYSTNAA